MARGVEPGAAGFASAAGRLNFRRGSGRSEAWHAESRCIAFARLLLRLNIDRACHLTEAVTAVPAEPAARVERATRRSLSGFFVNNRQIRAHWQPRQAQVPEDLLGVVFGHGAMP